MVRRINLVPAEQRRRTQTDMGLMLLIVAAIVVAGAIALSYLFYSGELSDREAELADLQAQNQQLEAQLASLSQYQALDQRRAALEDVVTRVYVGRTLVSEVLGDLSLVIPENVWLGNLNLTAPDPPPALSPETQAQGTVSPPATQGDLALVGNTYSFEDVARLLVRLEQIPAVSAVALGSAGAPTGSVDPKKEVRGFNLQATIRNVQSPDTQLPVSRVEVEAQ
ncbi:MAG: PilN domain-containing protein [Thermoleophilia bacterium]